MIISNSLKPTFDEFAALVNKTNDKLNEDCLKCPDYYRNRDGRKLEADVKKAMEIVAQDTVFNGTIELIGGQRFPDIIAKKYYGVEVKSTTQDHWITTGNSVLESTRIEDVEHIFLIFGKLATPVQFKARRYQDCLSDVVVTHYPRYKINMDLPAGKTVFDKMGIEYDEMRNLPNPISPVVNYYKQNLRQGESLWWIDNTEADEPVPMTVRLWKTLNPIEKNIFIVKGMIYFPEVFSGNGRKYDRFTLWLVTSNGIVSTSMRDSFSAGGKVTIITESGTFSDLPHIFEVVNSLKNDISLQLSVESENTLSNFWNIKNCNAEGRLPMWIENVSLDCSLGYSRCKEVLDCIFNAHL